MAEVSFLWDDGPNANAAFCNLYVYSPSGEKIDPRKEQIKYNKNGKWSYIEYRVFVPLGSIVIQVNQNTSRHRTRRVWVAAEGRPSLLSSSGTWGEGHRDWPGMEVEGILTQDQWRNILRSMLNGEIIEQWERNATIQSI
jgi:hypothetical protein